MAQAQAGVVGGTVGGFFEPGIRALGKIIGLFLIVIIILAIIAFVVLGLRWLWITYQTGQLASTVEHAGVQVEQTGQVAGAGLKSSRFAFLYPLIYPEQYNPVAGDSVVDNSAGRDLGVKIELFRPLQEFFRPNSDIRLLGTIVAEGLDKPIELEVYCSLEDYREGELIPARLTGLAAAGNRATVFEDERAELTAQCNFPGGVPVTKQVTSKRAELVVVYDFSTKAYQRVWFLDKMAIDEMRAGGLDPFDVYSVRDPLMDSERKVASVTTPGPAEVRLTIAHPQPLTSGSQYTLLVQMSRSFDLGNLQKINYLRLFVPQVSELDVQLGVGEDLVGASQCDFEHVGPSEIPGYTEYRLAQHRIEETNQDCDKKSLRDLALSESDCISFFKMPTYTCDFVSSVVPLTLSSDTIRAEANYIYKVSRPTVIDIRALPSELGEGLVA